MDSRLLCYFDIHKQRQRAESEVPVKLERFKIQEQRSISEKECTRTAKLCMRSAMISEKWRP